MIFGVPENGPIEVEDGNVATSDAEKIAFIFRYIGIEDGTIKSFSV